MNHIILNDKFSFERDQYCWHLHEWRDGNDKNGNPKRQKRTTYHSNLTQVCSMVIDRSAGDCKSMEEIIGLLNNCVHLLVAQADVME